MSVGLKTNGLGKDNVRVIKSHGRLGVPLLCAGISIGSFVLSLIVFKPEGERFGLTRGLFYTTLGFIHFISATHFLTNWGLQLRNKLKLMRSDIYDCANKLVSAMQACFSFIAGLLVCRSSCNRGFLSATHYVSEAYAWFGVAYFFYDLWSMYKVHLAKMSDKLIQQQWLNDINNKPEKARHSNSNLDKNMNVHSSGPDFSKDNVPMFKKIYDDYGNDFEMVAEKGTPNFFQYLWSEPLMVVHHMFIGSFGFWVIVGLRTHGDCIFGSIYMMEVSTPFVSFRSILSTLGLKDHRIYLVNGLTMMFLFFIFRICLLPFLFYTYISTSGLSIGMAMSRLPIECIISICILFLPQYYWFNLIVRGAIKVIRQQSSVREKREKKL